MSENSQTLRKPWWLTAFLTLLAVVTSAAAAAFLQQEPADPVAWMTGGVAFLLVLGALDALTAHVTLRDDEISIYRGLSRRRFYRGHITRVRWKAGEGISLELDDGLEVRLPELGRGPARAETIRRWIEEAGEGEVAD